MRLPSNLVAAARQEQRTDWLTRLPTLVDDVSKRWRLTIGEPYQTGGQTAWVAPVQDDRGRALVLKIAWPHPEAAHESDGLAAWHGRGAVLLHATAELDGATALLLEQCTPGTPLASRPEPEQDEIVAVLLLRLWIEPDAGHAFRPLAEMCADWAAGFDRKYSQLDPALARQGIELFRTLPNTAARQVLLCTDLHAENILAAEREPWLAIDPKPYVGDPTYDVVQHMLNCAERLHADPLGLVRRMAELTGLDADRLGLWLFARCVQESPDYPQLGAIARRIAPR